MIQLTSWKTLRPRLLSICRQFPASLPTRKFKSVVSVFALILAVWFLISFRCSKLPAFGYRHNSNRTVSRFLWKNRMNIINHTVEQLSNGQIGTGSGNDNAYDNNYHKADATAMLSIMSIVDATSPPQTGNTDVKENDPNRILFVQRAAKYVPQKILVHLDMKGAPPKLTYLRELLPRLSQMGATGLLIEYEDMFPYWGRLTGLSARNAYSYQDVKNLLAMAKDYGLEVIPLVQTFGHMEFVLKSRLFKGLREVSDYPQAICPSKSNSTDLIQEMIDQTMALHPDIRYLHIGCDEVFHLGSCRDCERRMAKFNYSRSPAESMISPFSNSRKNLLFLEHVHDVALYVKSSYPGVQPIVWDDMFRSIPAEHVRRSGLGYEGLVEPMIWAYSIEFDAYITSEILDKYAQLFPRVWAAGAFKGAFGETNYLPDVYGHALNTAAWLKLMRRRQFVHGSQFRNIFRGFVLTGWQRYDHFSVLCELLPVSVPSLAVSLLTAVNGRLEDQVVRNATSHHLGCPLENLGKSFSHSEIDLRTLQDDRTLITHLSQCEFPGNSAFRLMWRLQSLKAQVAKHLTKMTHEDGWLALYNLRRNFSNPFRVKDAAQRVTIYLRSTAALKRHAETVLQGYFETNSKTADEWVEQQIEPMIVALRLVEEKVRPFLSRDTWPRRPFS